VCVGVLFLVSLSRSVSLEGRKGERGEREIERRRREGRKSTATHCNTLQHTRVCVRVCVCVCVCV